MANTLLGMSADDLRIIKPEEVDWLITPEEFFYVAKTFDAFWEYDYTAAEEGRKGLHAQLTSGLHSDGFFSSRVLFAVGNMRQIMAHQMVRRLREDGRFNRPDFIIGVPTSANALARDVASILHVELGVMKKTASGEMVLETTLYQKSVVLLVEDVCTRGTGFKKALRAVLDKHPDAKFVRINPVVLNRGPLANFYVEGDDFRVLPVTSRMMADWNPETDGCPRCAEGSKVIKPKTPEENWGLLVNSQK